MDFLVIMGNSSSFWDDFVDLDHCRWTFPHKIRFANETLMDCLG